MKHQVRAGLTWCTKIDVEGAWQASGARSTA